MKCDELKSFEVGLGQMLEDGRPVVIAVYENNKPRLLKEEKVYLKSEVDKVLANKDKEIEDLKNLHYVDMMELDMENYKLKEQLRKQKRMRAYWISIVCYRKFSAASSVKEEVFWMKWHNYWADIADKLKKCWSHKRNSNHYTQRPITIT